MRITAFDKGDKNIGIAVSDSLRMTAQGIKTMPMDGCMEAESIVAGPP